jgi:hypothetical protein
MAEPELAQSNVEEVGFLSEGQLNDVVIPVNLAEIDMHVYESQGSDAGSRSNKIVFSESEKHSTRIITLQEPDDDLLAEVQTKHKLAQTSHNQIVAN